MLCDVLGDRLQQMRLPEAGAAVDEERVVRLRRRLGDGQRAAWAKRFEEPITNRSNVYFGFRPRDSPSATAEEGSATVVRRLVGRGPLGAPTAAPAPHVTNDCLEQPDEVALDPLAREVVRNRDDEDVVGELAAFASANHVPYVVSLSAPLSRPETSLHRLSAVSSPGCSTRSSLHSFSRGSEAASIAPFERPDNHRQGGHGSKKDANLQEVFGKPQALHRCGKRRGREGERATG